MNINLLKQTYIITIIDGHVELSLKRQNNHNGLSYEITDKLKSKLTSCAAINAVTYNNFSAEVPKQ